MANFYGYRCYNLEGKPLGWLYTANAEREYNHTNKSLDWCKRWKSEKGALKNFDWYNTQWCVRSGGFLKIEIMPEIVEEGKYWDKANSEIVKESKAKYDRKNPIWSFRLRPEIAAWLEVERQDKETDTALLNRQLEKLMKLEE